MALTGCVKSSVSPAAVQRPIENLLRLSAQKVALGFE